MTVDIKILGSGCRNCQRLEATARQAVADLDLDATIDKVTDAAAIVGYGVLSTPGLMIDGVVVSTGRVPAVDEVTEFLAAPR